VGTVTKSTPFGSIDRAFYPAKVALGCGSTFFARTMDTDPKHMQEVCLRASEHKGLSFIEVLQNCVIFNDGIHENYTNRQLRDDWVFFLEHGKPMIFGKEKNKGMMLKGAKLEVVTIGEDGITEKDIAIHDENDQNLAYILANLRPHVDPLPMGVLLKNDDICYDQKINEQNQAIKDKKGPGSMKDLINAGNTWTVG